MSPGDTCQERKKIVKKSLQERPKTEANGMIEASIEISTASTRVSFRLRVILPFKVNLLSIS